MAAEVKSETVSLAKILSYAQAVARNDPATSKSDPPERTTLFTVRDALFVGTKKVPGSKRRRRGEETSFVNRPCSPTLFPMHATSSISTQAASSAPPAKRQLLSDSLETVLNTAVTPLYERAVSNGAFEDGEKLVPAHRYTSLGYLLLPIRRPSVLDSWTTHEIAVFESAICLHGKRFDMIKAVLPTKTVKEVIEFYYVWKNTSHKPVWKKTFKAVEG